MSAVELLATVILCMLAIGLAAAVLRALFFGIVVLMDFLFDRNRGT